MSAPRILVPGAPGQIGTEVTRRAPGHGFSPIGLPSSALDVTSQQSIADALSRYQPHIVLNCAAYTSVDKAETDTARAFSVNEGGAKNLADACKARGIPLLHISTDYVYSGKREGMFRESDPLDPVSVYGKSKLAGERAIQHLRMPHVIMRTAWVYADHGNNFLKTMLKLAENTDNISVVNDQYGAPTFAGDIANTLLIMASRVLEESENIDLYGIFNYSGKGYASWYDFAQTIFDARYMITGHRPALQGIPTSAYPTPAKRPRNSVLDCALLERVYGIKLHEWKSRVEMITHRTLLERKNEQIGTGGEAR